MPCDPGYLRAHPQTDQHPDADTHANPHADADVEPDADTDAATDSGHSITDVACWGAVGGWAGTFNRLDAAPGDARDCGAVEASRVDEGRIECLPPNGQKIVLTSK